jgi:hypothetical protein
MPCGVFSGCTSLCELIFDDPPHLKELDLPPSAFSSLSIPNCVEVVSGGIGTQQGQGRVLYFDEKSCLRHLSFTRQVNHWGAAPNFKSGIEVFLRLPEMILRRFRSKFEEL